MKLKHIWFVIIACLLLTACGGDNDDEDDSSNNTPVPPTPTPLVLDEVDEGTQEPTFTPESQTSAPGIELVQGSPNTCVNEDTTQSTLLGFDAVYYELTTANSTVVEMSAPEIGVFASLAGSGENKDGEEGWGFYPEAYALEDNTPITVTLTTYAGADDTSEPTGLSVLTYDCTTGETISKSYSQFSE